MQRSPPPGGNGRDPPSRPEQAPCDGGDGVGVDALQVQLAAQRGRTPRAGAVAALDPGACELEIVEVPLVTRCNACGTESETDDVAVLRCPECAGTVAVVSGNEVLVTSVRYAEA